MCHAPYICVDFVHLNSVFKALPLYKLSITEKVVQAVQSMLLPQEGSLSIHTSLPASGDGSSPVMAAVRLLAEIRTRSVLPVGRTRDTRECLFWVIVLGSDVKDGLLTLCTCASLCVCISVVSKSPIGVKVQIHHHKFTLVEVQVTH